MNVIVVNPQGFCGGVQHAIRIAKKTKEINPNTPIYIWGLLVHNESVKKALELLDITSLPKEKSKLKEILDSLPRGIIITTAHGISQQEVDLMKQLGFSVVDATCPVVLKTAKILRDSLDSGHDIIYVGKHGHPESEAMESIDPDHIFLIEKEHEIDQIVLSRKEVLVTNQTTMSQADILPLFYAIQRKYPQAILLDEICQATKSRQAALKESIPMGDIVIVVGDPRSNNTQKLVEIGMNSLPTLFIETVENLSWEQLKGKKSAIVTSGASTPPHLTEHVIAFLRSDGLESIPLDYRKII